LVELISTDKDAPNHLPSLSAAAGMIPHEMLTHLGAHVPRQYEAPSAPVVVETASTRVLSGQR
jgi:hypothetical protein